MAERTYHCTCGDSTTVVGSSMAVVAAGFWFWKQYHLGAGHRICTRAEQEAERQRRESEVAYKAEPAHVG